MLEKLFLEHPASVGETYLEHFTAAFRFGSIMVVGGLACIIHAVFPFAFRCTASRVIRSLHVRLVLKRNSKDGSGRALEWII